MNKLPKVVTMKVQKRLLISIFILLTLFPASASAYEFRVGPIKVISGKEDAFVLAEWWLYDYDCMCPGSDPSQCCPLRPIAGRLDAYYFNGGDLLYLGKYESVKEEPIAFVLENSLGLYNNSWLIVNDSKVFWFKNEWKCVRSIGQLNGEEGVVKVSPPDIYMGRRIYQVNKTSILPVNKIAPQHIHYKNAEPTIKIEGSTLVFLNGTKTFKLPLSEITKYFAVKEDVKHLKGVFLSRGVLLYYPYAHHFDENKTLIEKFTEIPLLFYDGKHIKVLTPYEPVNMWGEVDYSKIKSVFDYHECTEYADNENITIKPSTSSRTQKENKTANNTPKEGICGTGILIVLSLIPLPLKKLKA